MSEAFTANVARAVADEMARQRRSQVAVAAALGVSQTYVWRRLTGEVAFDVTELAAIAEFLGVPVQQFLTDAGNAA